MLKSVLTFVFVLAITSVHAADDPAYDPLDEGIADDPLSLSQVNKAAKAAGRSAEAVGKGAKAVGRLADKVQKATAKKSSDELLDGTADDPLSLSTVNKAAKLVGRGAQGVQKAAKVASKGAKIVEKATARKSSDPLAADGPWRHRGRHHPKPLWNRKSGENVNKVNIENNVNIDNN